MYVYADILLVINTVMNGTILVVTAWAAGIHYKVWRLLAAALLGACYALAGLYPAAAPLYTPAAKLAVAAALVWLAYDTRSWRSLLFATACFYLVSILLGGAVLGWALLAASPGKASWPQVTWQHLAAGAMVTVSLALFIARRLLAGLNRRRLLLPLAIEYAGRRVQLTALLDTGNNLFTLGGLRPVVVVEYSALGPLLSSQVNDYLHRTPPPAWLAGLECCNDREWLARVQVIPCRSVGGANLLLGFRPDSLTVQTATGSVVADDVIVGIHSGRLSAVGTYAALLHPAVLGKLDRKGEAGRCA
jgi:Sporulation factor SpoIIGA.